MFERTVSMIPERIRAAARRVTVGMRGSANYRRVRVDPETKAIEEFIRESRWARHRNPVVKDITDIQPWLYYDRLTAAAGAVPSQTLIFYSAPMTSTKTKLDTNLKQASKLADPKHFLCMSLRFVFSNMLAADIVGMTLNYYLEWWISDKCYAEGHFDLYPGGAGVSGFAMTTVAATSQFVANNGVADPYAINSWGVDRGVHILQGQTFNLNATAPTAYTLIANNVAPPGSGMNIRCIMDGILYREVQ